MKYIFPVQQNFNRSQVERIKIHPILIAMTPIMAKLVASMMTSIVIRMKVKKHQSMRMMLKQIVRLRIKLKSQKEVETSFL